MSRYGPNGSRYVVHSSGVRLRPATTQRVEPVLGVEVPEHDPEPGGRDGELLAVVAERDVAQCSVDIGDAVAELCPVRDVEDALAFALVLRDQQRPVVAQEEGLREAVQPGDWSRICNVSGSNV